MTHAGAATYDIPVPFPTEFSELEQPAHGQLQPTSPYGLAAGSPDETCKEHHHIMHSV